MTYEAWRISYQSSEQAARAAYAECERLWAKAESMEQQKPVEWQTRTRPAWNDGTWGPWRKCSEEYAEDIKKTPLLHDWLYEARALYALPGAQSAPKAVAYLDIGAGGYMDIGTDLPDEALAALPKGRHMLGVIGTYGVDGYVPAQSAPSVPDGWKEAAIAWEVCASIHREYGKGKDPFFSTRQGDFVKHANAARAMLAAAPEVTIHRAKGEGK